MTLAMPNYRLFQRIYEVNVDGMKVDAMRVGFTIEKTLKREPNTCELAIYNLAEGTRQKFHASESVPVMVRAGYKEIGLVTIFAGEMREAFSVPEEDGTWITVLRAGDGDAAIKKGRVSKGWRAGVSGGRVVEDLARGLKVGIGNMKKEVSKQFAAGNFTIEGLGAVLDAGMSLSGSFADSMDKMIGSTGGEWSVQDGQLQVLQAGDVLRSDDGRALWITRLNRDSGLEQTPSISGKGQLSCRARIQPGLNPGMAIEVESQQMGGRRYRGKSHGVSGIWRIDKTTYIGDTHGTDWNAELQCTEVVGI